MPGKQPISPMAAAWVGLIPGLMIAGNVVRLPDHGAAPEIMIGGFCALFLAAAAEIYNASTGRTPKPQPAAEQDVSPAI